MTNLRTEWMGSLAMRENLLRNDIPHVPILVEDIPKYVSLIDYEENCIKTIQTIGEIVPGTERLAKVLTVTPENKAMFLISLRNLRIEDVYVKNSDDTYSTIWEQHNVFKLFGTLRKYKSEAVLEVHYLIPVNDVIGSWQTLKLLSMLVRCEIRQYCRSEQQDELLKRIWDKMKAQKKRLVNMNV